MKRVLWLLVVPAFALASGPGSSTEPAVIVTATVGAAQPISIPISEINARSVLPDTGEIRITLQNGSRYVVSAEALAAAENQRRSPASPEAAEQPCPNLQIALPDVPDPANASPLAPSLTLDETARVADESSRTNPPVLSSAATAGPIVIPPLPSDLPRNLSGSSSSSPSLLSPSQMIRTLSSTAQIAESARGQEIVSSAIEDRQKIQREASDDHRLLSDTYRQLPNDHLANAMQRARDSLQVAADTLSSSNAGSIERSEQSRFRNYFLNARDKAEMGLASLRTEQEKQSLLGETSPFAGLVRTPESNPLARSPELAEIFGSTLPQGSAATSSDALVNRLVMFNGLPPQERARMLKQLKLAEAPRFKLPSGQTQSIAILHNGYILGGGNGSGGAGSALDCSSFVSSILPADVRKGRFTTLDFRMMWIYLRNGRFPNPPHYESAREKLVKETALSFSAINIYEHERLAPGDILVYRLPDEAIGHVFLIRSYNHSTLTTEVVEAAQSAGTIREREFPLSVYPMTARKRFLRPGLMALRIKPVTTRACAYRDHRQQPAPASPPHQDGAPDGTAGGAL